MKWAGLVFAAMLYLAWPYYTLIELTQAIRAADAPTINRLVDWDRVRTSVKSQLQTHLEARQRMATRNPARATSGSAALGNAFALTLANSMIDKMLTPEGIAHLAQVRREMPSRARNTTTARAARSTSGSSRHDGLLRRVKFAFFVSPIHFRLDLREPRGAGALTVMLMFKGSGWQVSDVRLPAAGKAMVLSARPTRPRATAMPAR